MLCRNKVCALNPPSPHKKSSYLSRVLHGNTRIVRNHCNLLNSFWSSKSHDCSPVPSESSSRHPSGAHGHTQAHCHTQSPTEDSHTNCVISTAWLTTPWDDMLLIYLIPGTELGKEGEPSWEASSSISPQTWDLSSQVRIQRQPKAHLRSEEPLRSTLSHLLLLFLQI